MKWRAYSASSYPEDGRQQPGLGGGRGGYYGFESVEAAAAVAEEEVEAARARSRAAAAAEQARSRAAAAAEAGGV